MIGRWIFIRDDRVPMSWWAVIAVLGLVALIAVFPLRVALMAADDGRAISARSVSGSVWHGTVRDARVGGLPIGDVAVSLRILPLFAGKTRFAVERPAGFAGMPIAAVAGGGGDLLFIADANGQLPVGAMMAPLPVRAISVADLAITMRSGQCVSAQGTLGVVLSTYLPGGGDDVLLSGPIRCEDGAIVAPMVGPSGMERLLLRLGPDRQWSADLLLSGLPPEISVPLIEGGFRSRPNGIGLSATGRWGE